MVISLKDSHYWSNESYQLQSDVNRQRTKTTKP